MTSPIRTDREELERRAAKAIAETFDGEVNAYTTALSKNLWVLEEAILAVDRVRNMQPPGFDPLEELRAQIKSRVESWLKDDNSDLFNVPLCICQALYDWLYPPSPPSEPADSQVTKTWLVKLRAEAIRRFNRLDLTMIVDAVSRDSAMHKAACELSGDPTKFRSGDAYSKEYQGARAEIESCTEVVPRGNSVPQAYVAARRADGSPTSGSGDGGAWRPSIAGVNLVEGVYNGPATDSKSGPQEASRATQV